MSRFVQVSFLLVLSLVAAPVAAQQFGGALVVTDGQILVGETANQTLAGLVYVFEPADGAWSEVAQLRRTDALRAPDGFGRTLGWMDGTLLVGAPLDGEGAGGVHLYTRSGSGQWTDQGSLPVGEPDADARVGSALSVSGALVAVGAPGARDGAGAVHLYRHRDGTWEAAGTVTGPPSSSGFGRALTLAGDHLLVTAAGAQRGETVVFAFLRSGPAERTWSAVEPPTVPGLPERSGFGSAVALGSGEAWVGAPDVAARSGRVFRFVFDGEAGGWTLAGTLEPFVSEPNARFGSSLQMSGAGLLVGATGGDGSLYRVTMGPDGPDALQRVTAADLPDGAGFGGSAVLEGTIAVVGALGEEERSGAAYVYAVGEDGAWTRDARLANAARGFPAIVGDEVHCLEGQASLFDCKDVNITAFLPISELGGSRGTRVNDIWGWTDPQTGVEYVIVGRTNGTSFVDIRDPYNPVYVGDLPKSAETRTTIWRDMKVYRNHVYIVADAAGEHGVQVFDLTELRRFDGEPLTFAETFRYDGIHSAHNIVINEETGFAYAVGNSGGGETCGGGLHMINLEDPARPEFAGCFAEPATGRRGTGYSHDAQCVVYHGPDAEHQGKEVCFGSNETALNIADVTDKAAPVTIATQSYPNAAYAHQGWLTEDHTYFYMNDEGDEPQGLVDGTRTLVWDVTDLDDPVLVKEHIAETTATDHNLYVKGDVMYQSNYSAGLRVLDVSDPANPVEIGFFDTSPYEGGASWSNYPFFESGIIAVTGTGDGLFLLRNMARRNLVP